MLEINGFRNQRSNYTILNHYDYSETPVINRHVPVDIVFIECGLFKVSFRRQDLAEFR